ncbi:MAG: DUF2911 domain-containing protein [Bacteroidota bacterium]
MTTTKLVATVAIVGVISLTHCQSKKSDDHQHALSSEQTPADTLNKSLPREEHAQIGAAHVMITYHAPAVRGRVIWGGLVPLGQVWVTGAHHATTLEVSKKFSLGEQAIDAGKYALFTIPGETEWTVIINKNWDQHLTDEYDQKDDIVRIRVKADASNPVHERLKYSVTPTGENMAELAIRWAKVRVMIPFKVLE